LSIYNYTAKAQYANVWTKPERVCRGLIVEDETNKVIARGPEKFFNYGQTGAPEVSLDTEVQVTRKEDGSLGIGWTYDGHYGIATRGSFASEQAVHATTTKLDDTVRQAIDLNTSKGRTIIYEIVYPGNRIVLDYGDRDELIPLGEVDNESGLIVGRFMRGVARLRATLAEVLALQIPADEEGYVLDILEDGVTGHIKLKGEEYRILHGLLTNTNARRIWVQLAARDCHKFIERPEDWAYKLGHDPADFERVDVTKEISETLLSNVPDEFYDWVTKQIDSITDEVCDLIIQSTTLAAQISLIGDKRTRYEAVRSHPMCKEILNFAEGKDEATLVTKAWKLAKPTGDETPFKTKED
jgi:RNA ligase